MTDWNSLKVTELRAELKKRGLPQTGLKQALVARLTTADIGDGSDSEATIQGDPTKIDTNSVASPDTISPILPSPDVATNASSLHDTTEITGSAQIDILPETIAEESPIPTQTGLGQGNETAASEPPEVPGRKDTHTSALPSVEPQEALEDRQKRKRRSKTPPPSADDILRKRFRRDDNGAEGSDIVTSAKDAEWVEGHNGVDRAEVNAMAEEVTPFGVKDPIIVDAAKEEIVVESVAVDAEQDTAMTDGAREQNDAQINAPADNNEGEKETQKVLTPEAIGGSQDYSRERRPSDAEDSSARIKDSRFKNLFPAGSPPANTTRSTPRETATPQELDRIISPAIHPATSALYIRELIRPIHPPQLRTHLSSLAAPPGENPNSEIITDFFLDTLRTHAFVTFSNVSAASRVRSALHDRTWPAETSRNPLWVDFVPPDKISEWVQQESTGGAGNRLAKRWEISYDADADRNVTASLQELGKISRQIQPVRMPRVPGPDSQSFASARKSEPVREPQIPSAPRNPSVSGPGTTNTDRLDDMFPFTTTKPKIYFQPVPKSLVNRRLDNIDALLSKDSRAGVKLTGESNRYTFQDGDVLVDRGPEIFLGIRPPVGFRGPRGGGPRGSGPRRDGPRYGGDGPRYGNDGPRYGGGTGRGGYGGGSDRGGFDRRYDSYRGSGRGGDYRRDRD